ncbi:MAG: sodium/hydrogen exchanger, partial [Flavipsychrobacter sp.]|nr:sodium/hydrogen exchanger [Flavipsychrobacter sp.]
GEVSTAFWLQLGISSVVFVCIVFFVFPIIIRWFFKNFEDSISQYIFVLATVFLASFLAEAAGLEALIGAFFAGLVLNRFVPHSSHLMNRIDFVGNALFIPFFLIGVGMLVDFSVLVKGWGALKVAGVIITVAIATKYLAAIITQKIFRLTTAEGKMIFGLSTSRAAATLAIILVGYNIITGETEFGEPIRLLNEDVLNGTVLLILVSCSIGSFVTERAAKDLALELSDADDHAEDKKTNEKVLISLGYPELVPDLVDLGITLAPKKSLIPIYALHVTDDEQLYEQGVASGKKILEKAISYATASDNILIPVKRYDSSISNGIVYTIKEHNVTDVVIGLHRDADQKNFLGEITESIIRRVFETIYIYKPVQPFNTLKRLVVVAPAKAETEVGFLHWLNKLLMIAREGGMSIAFYAEAQTLTFIKSHAQRIGSTLKLLYNEFSNWDDFLVFSGEVKPNDLFVIISSRKGNNSYTNQLSKLQHYLSNYFQQNSFIVVFPAQLESGINMGDIEQADSALIETISDQIDAIGSLGKRFRRIFKK